MIGQVEAPLVWSNRVAAPSESKRQLCGSTKDERGGWFLETRASKRVCPPTGPARRNQSPAPEPEEGSGARGRPLFSPCPRLVGSIRSSACPPCRPARLDFPGPLIRFARAAARPICQPVWPACPRRRPAHSRVQIPNRHHGHYLIRPTINRFASRRPPSGQAVLDSSAWPGPRSKHLDISHVSRLAGISPDIRSTQRAARSRLSPCALSAPPISSWPGNSSTPSVRPRPDKVRAKYAAKIRESRDVCRHPNWHFALLGPISRGAWRRRRRWQQQGRCVEEMNEALDLLARPQLDLGTKSGPLAISPAISRPNSSASPRAASALVAGRLSGFPGRREPRRRVGFFASRPPSGSLPTRRQVAVAQRVRSLGWLTGCLARPARTASKLHLGQGRKFPRPTIGDYDQDLESGPRRPRPCGRT